MPIGSNISEFESQLVKEYNCKIKTSFPGGTKFINFEKGNISYSNSPIFESHDYAGKVLLNYYYPELFIALINMRSIDNEIFEGEYVQNTKALKYNPFRASKEFVNGINQYNIKYYKKLNSNEIITLFYTKPVSQHVSTEKTKRLIGFKLTNTFPFSPFEIGDEFKIDIHGYLHNKKTASNSQFNLTEENVLNNYSHLFDPIYEEVPIEITYIVKHGKELDFPVLITKEGAYFTDNLVKINDLKNIWVYFENRPKYLKADSERWNISLNSINIGCKKEIPLASIKSIIDIFETNFK